MKASLGVLCLLWAVQSGAAQNERYAIVFGNNQGSPSRPRLWFAERDAERTAGTLVELGDFAPSQVILLKGKGKAELRKAVAQVEAKLRRAVKQEGSMLLLYYSGHANTAGLELGTEGISYRELRALADASSAAVKVVLVDACQAGALTQVKGSRALPLLDFPLPLADDGVRGTAYVASTAVGESAQESASLGGSFFSHHLEVGLRGAADGDGDGRVTLNEAFRYTSARTVVGTAGTVLGSQHPTYEVKMAGRGDLVLSDLRRANARLVLPPDSEGEYLVRGGPGILAEFSGSAKGLTLGLPAGRYELQRREGKKRTAGQLVLGAGETRQVDGLVALGLEQSMRKGGDVFEVFAGPALVAGLLPGFGVAPALRLGASQSLGWARARVRLDGLSHHGTQGLLAYQLRGLGASASLLFGTAWGRFLLEIGPELGGIYAHQQTSLQNWPAFLWSTGAAASISTHLTRLGELRVGLDVSPAALWVPLNHRWTVRAGLGSALTVSYGF